MKLKKSTIKRIWLRFSKIKDLNKEEFIKENTNEETYRDYKNLAKIETISTISVLPTMVFGGVGIGASAGLSFNEQRRKQLKEVGIELEK